MSVHIYIYSIHTHIARCTYMHSHTPVHIHAVRGLVKSFCGDLSVTDQYRRTALSELFKRSPWMRNYNEEL